VTYNVTVTVPSGGMVALPLMPAPLTLKLAVLALVLKALVALASVRPLGITSLKLAPVAVPPPLLLMTRMNAAVLPLVVVPGVTELFTMTRSTCGVTVIVLVLVLLPGVVSVVFGGRLKLATLVIVPEAEL